MGAIQVPGFGTFINWTSLVIQFGNKNALQGLIGPWRPPQWNEPQLYSVEITEVSAESSGSKALFEGQVVSDTATNPNVREKTKSTMYFFDAILRAEHSQELVRTVHPIQTGAAIVDHAYLQPARVQLEIGVSDAMARYQSGQFTGSGNKSVSAFQTLLDLQAKRLPITLTTRLKQYENMVIESVRAVENNATRNALRADVVFAQIMMASVGQTTIGASARPDQTDLTNEGTKQPLAPDPTVQDSSSLAGFP
jgi:hypothetical protein